MKAFRKLAAAVITLAAALMLVCSASAASTNGISVSASEVAPGGTFTVYLTVPKTVKADTLSVRTEFDDSAFTVVSWEPVVPNGVANYGDDFFTVSAANASRTIDLSGGLTMKAVLAVKSGVTSGTYRIKLVKNSIAYVEDNGCDYVELWNPSAKEVSVTVKSGNGGNNGNNGNNGGGNNNTDPPEYVPGDKTPSGSGNSGKTDNDNNKTDTDKNKTDNDKPDSGKQDADEKTNEGVDETPSGNDGKNSGGNSGNNGGGSSGGSSGSGSKISFSSTLDYLSGGKVLLATKESFFDDDVIIEIKNTPEAEEAAVRAADNLGYTAHDHYSFDLSVYRKSTGAKIHSLPDGGYLRITMPLPVNFTGLGEGLAVYHTESGYPQRMASEIKYEDGQVKLVFMADSFSPYMIVDTLHRSIASSNTSQGGTSVNNQTGNTGKDAQIIDAKPATAGKTINPNTGVAAAIVIPAAVTGCVLLARKHTKKRKRAKRKDDPEEDF